MASQSVLIVLAALVTATPATAPITGSSAVPASAPAEAVLPKGLSGLKLSAPMTIAATPSPRLAPSHAGTSLPPVEITGPSS